MLHHPRISQLSSKGQSLFQTEYRCPHGSRQSLETVYQNQTSQHSSWLNNKSYWHLGIVVAINPLKVAGLITCQSSFDFLLYLPRSTHVSASNHRSSPHSRLHPVGSPRKVIAERTARLIKEYVTVNAIRCPTDSHVVQWIEVEARFLDILFDEANFPGVSRDVDGGGRSAVDELSTAVRLAVGSVFDGAPLRLQCPLTASNFVRADVTTLNGGSFEMRGELYNTGNGCLGGRALRIF